MFKNYLKIAIRNIKKNKIYSLISVLGLTTGIGCSILLSIFIISELSFDKYHENYKDIYRIIRKGYATTPAALGPGLKKEIPEVVFSTRVIKRNNILISSSSHKAMEKEIYWTEPQTFKIFKIPFIFGDSKTALNDPDSILLSKSTSQKYFGNQNPIGKKLLLGQEKIAFKVRGVFADMSTNSHFVMNIIAPYKRFFKITKNDIKGWMSNFTYTYCKLKKGADSEEFENKIISISAKHKQLFEGSKFQTERFKKKYLSQPISVIHLSSHLRAELAENNHKINILIFSIIAFLVLMISIINYINLSTAQSTKRAMEVGLRKTLGADRKQLVHQIFCESSILIFFSIILSLILVILFLPILSQLMGRQLGLSFVNNPFFILTFLIITIILGLLAGWYPAFNISRFKPISVLNGTFDTGSKGKLRRNLLILFQFSIAIVLIVFTFTIRQQLSYINNKDMGYNKEKILIVKIRDRNISKNLQVIKTKLLSNPNILQVSASQYLPNEIKDFTRPDWFYNDKNKTPIYFNSVDFDFVNLYNLQIASGRNFSKNFLSDKKGAFLINEAAVKTGGLSSPIGKKINHWNGKEGFIVGILKDFNFQSVHNPIKPLYLYLNPAYASKMSIKMNSNKFNEVNGFVKGVMKNFSPEYPYEYSFFDDQVNKSYFMEQKMYQILSLFTILTIIIVCLGVLGLSIFAAEKRLKEMGIRKVLGASLLTILSCHVKPFLKWICYSSLIAWPIAYVFSIKWLQNFVYRMEPDLMTFLIPTGILLIITSLTISYQSIKIAKVPLVSTLRQN